MAKSISDDLGFRVIAAVDGGLSRRAAAEHFGVAAANAVRWVREFEAGKASGRRHTVAQDRKLSRCHSRRGRGAGGHHTGRTGRDASIKAWRSIRAEHHLAAFMPG